LESGRRQALACGSFEVRVSAFIAGGTPTEGDFMIHPAIDFLNHLDNSPDATFNIEHYTDLPSGALKPRPDRLAKRYANQTLQQVESLLPRLHSVNDMGAGIFVARNQCTGHRSEAGITRVRGVHADMDKVSDSQMGEIVGRLQPSIIVHSSPGRQQHYWQLAEGQVLGKDETKAINQCLADLGADSAAVDPSRLLRLPGFKHMKYRAEGKTPTVTAEYHGVCYTAICPFRHPRGYQFTKFRRR
jgi:RepB DNA-primase from phage plasmid